MKNSQVTVNYSLGESFIQLHNTQNAIIAQGFEQYIISTSTAATEAKNQPLVFIYHSNGYIAYYHVPVRKTINTDLFQ